ncbi:MAG: chain-length determining protein [Bacteroidales bacterium]|nr:chain-length determining protein [Bacteroidales bacterium]
MSKSDNNTFTPKPSQEPQKVVVSNGDEQELNLSALGTRLWEGRRLLLKWAMIGAAVGLLIALTTPRDFVTQVRLAPESTDNNKLSGLSSLAAMAGISLGGNAGTDAVSPELYPEVVASVPFVVDLFDVDITHALPDAPQDIPRPITLRYYVQEMESDPWIMAVMNFPRITMGAIHSLLNDEEDGEGRKVDPFHLTREENRVVDAFRGSISADVDSKTDIITITVAMQDPLVSAVVADTVVERLKDYIIDYRTNKARQDLAYAERLNEEARDEYYAAQKRYADYADRNQGITSRTGKIEEERLQNEASLAFTLYNSTAQRVQMAKAQVQEITPVYTVLQPATVPDRPAGPRRILILIVCVGLATIGALVWHMWLGGFSRKAWAFLRQW